jgi:hypothetical protein
MSSALHLKRIIVRKLFHFLALAMFVPVTLMQVRWSESLVRLVVLTAAWRGWRCVIKNQSRDHHRVNLHALVAEPGWIRILIKS